MHGRVLQWLRCGNGNNLSSHTRGPQLSGKGQTFTEPPPPGHMQNIGRRRSCHRRDIVPAVTPPPPPPPPPIVPGDDGDATRREAASAAALRTATLTPVPPVAGRQRRQALAMPLPASRRSGPPLPPYTPLCRELSSQRNRHSDTALRGEKGREEREEGGIPMAMRCELTAWR